MSQLVNAIFFDTETTGFVGEDGAICEIAMIEVRESKVVDRLHFILNPEKKMTIGAAKANGFKDSDFLGKPKFSEIEPEVTAWLDLAKTGSTISVLGYNVEKFDRVMLELSYTRIGKKLPDCEWVDVWKIATKLISTEDMFAKVGTTSRSQTNVAKFFGIDAIGAHRAMNDCRILFDIYVKLLEYEQVVKTVPKLTLSVKLTKPTDIQQTKIKSATDASVAAILAIKPEKIASDAIATVKAFIALYGERMKTVVGFSVTDDESSSKAASNIIWLTARKKEVVASRQKSIFPVKNLSKIIEEMFRDILTKPIELALNDMSEKRSRYLSKQLEIKKEAAEKQREVIEQAAQQLSQLAFDKAKADNKGIDAAVNVAAAVYDAAILPQREITVDTVTKTVVDGGKLTDEVIYNIEIIDASLVPSRFMVPSIELIQKYVDKTEGKVPVAGILIIETIKTKIRSARS